MQTGSRLLPLFGVPTGRGMIRHGSSEWAIKWPVFNWLCDGEFSAMLRGGGSSFLVGSCPGKTLNSTLSL